MKVEVKKLRDPGILEAKKLRCMWKRPLPPCSIFLAMKGFIKILFGAGNGASLPCKQIPAQIKTLHNHGMVGNDKRGGRTTPELKHYTATNLTHNTFSQTPARLTVGHLRPWLMLPWVALGCLALPYLCCLVTTGPWLRNWGAGFLSYVLNWTLTRWRLLYTRLL